MELVALYSNEMACGRRCRAAVRQRFDNSNSNEQTAQTCYYGKFGDAISCALFYSRRAARSERKCNFLFKCEIKYCRNREISVTGRTSHPPRTRAKTHDWGPFRSLRCENAVRLEICLWLWTGNGI